MSRLHRGHDPRACRPLEIGRVHALEVLDPVGQRGPRERSHEIERATHGRIADGVHGTGDPMLRREPHGALRLLRLGERHAAVATALVRLQHPGGAAAEAPVQEHLHPAEGEPLGARAAALAGADQCGERGDRRVKEYAQAQPPGRLQPGEGCSSGVVLDVVDPGHAQAMGFGLCLEQRPVHPIGGRARQHPASPARPPARAAARWAHPWRRARSAHPEDPAYRARSARPEAPRC